MVASAVMRGKCPVLRLSMMLHGSRVLHSDYWKYALPILINQLGWGCGVAMYSVIMGHLGSDATAANSIASIVRSMIASLCWGIASGVGIITGGMLGRNELEGICFQFIRNESRDSSRVKPLFFIITSGSSAIFQLYPQDRFPLPAFLPEGRSGPLPPVPVSGLYRRYRRPRNPYGY